MVQVRVCDDDGTPVDVDTNGEVCVRGENVTVGYEVRDHMPKDPNLSAFHQDATTGQWLRTGDKGFVDVDGYLCLVGRFKEIINRGGVRAHAHRLSRARARSK